MRAILQRVSEASVTIESRLFSQIGNGFLIFLGIEENDSKEDIDWLVKKISNMRIFGDNEGKMNLSIQDISGEVLVVSQFTLYASTKKGNRPSFIKSAKSKIAIPLYEKFIKTIQNQLTNEVKTGVFGADMKVQLINDGPVTIMLDSKDKE